MKRMNLLKIKTPARASIWYLCTSAVSKGVGIAVTPIFTRLQSEGDYGKYTLYVSILGILSVIASAFNSGSPIYKGLRMAQDKKAQYLRSAILTSLTFCSAICLLLFAFTGFFELDLIIASVISIQLICDSIVAIKLSDAKFSYRYTEVAAVGIFESFAAPLLSVLILTRFGGDYRVRVYSTLAVSLCTAAYALLTLYLAYKKEPPSESKVKYNLKDSMNLLPHTLSSALSSQADKLVFTALIGTGALAKYSVAHSLGLGLLFVVGAVGSALNPWIIRRISAKEEWRVAEVCKLILRVLASSTVFLVALSPEAMRILAPSGYYEAIYAVFPIALSALISFLISVCTVALIYVGRSSLTAYSSIISLTLGIALNFLLIPRINYLGAGIALLISQVGAGLWLLFCLYKSGYAHIFPTRAFLYYFMITAILGAVSVLLYDYPAIRVLLLCLPAWMMLGSLFSAGRLVRE